MNRFIIEERPRDIAKSLCDQHIVKMPLEEAQMLCTAVWHHRPRYAEEHNLYKPVHQKHPCTLWAQRNRSNYTFAWQLYNEMLNEYTNRYGKIHGASKHKDVILQARWLMPWSRAGGITKHPQCFSGHDDLKTKEFFPIEAYRKFYIVDKSRFARYKYTNKPQWMTGEVA